MNISNKRTSKQLVITPGTRTCVSLLALAPHTQCQAPRKLEEIGKGIIDTEVPDQTLQTLLNQHI